VEERIEKLLKMLEKLCDQVIDMRRKEDMTEIRVKCCSFSNHELEDLEKAINCRIGFLVEPLDEDYMEITLFLKEDTKVKCKYCVYFLYTADKIEGIKEDGWCTLYKRFRMSYQPACFVFRPRVKIDLER
jgi:hypothetical protein